MRVFSGYSGFQKANPFILTWPRWAVRASHIRSCFLQARMINTPLTHDVIRQKPHLPSDQYIVGDGKIAGVVETVNVVVAFSLPLLSTEVGLIV